MKKIKYLTIILLGLLILVGCQKVSETRTEFCSSLREVGTLAVELKDVKVDQPVDEVRTKVESLQQKKKNLERLAKITPIEGLDKLVTAIDAVSQAVAEVSGNTLGPAAEKINAAGVALENTYNELNSAVCEAK